MAVCRRVLFESSTGFVTFGTRSYNPAWERLTQQNTVAGSLGNPASLNRYLYAKDDSVNVVDPSGADCFEAAAILLFSTLVLIGAILFIPEAALASIGAFIAAIAAGGQTLGAIITAIGSYGLAVIFSIDLGRCVAGG